MARKVALLPVSLLTVVVLLLVSCGPRTSAPTPSAPTPARPTPVAPAPAAPTPTIPAAPTPAASTEKPKYGGTINILLPSDRESFDASSAPIGFGASVSATVYEQLISHDWSRGPAGTGEVDWASGYSKGLAAWGPNLAESWEIPQAGVWNLKIRQGVHWALNPSSEASRLMNGREMTTDDVVFSLQRFLTFPSSYVRVGQAEMAKVASVEKTGPWAIVIRTPVDPQTGLVWVVQGGAAHHVVPPDVIQKYGNVMDWRNAVGTGPFMLVDYVSGSVATLIRNPNYWRKDPLGPGKGNQLPYPDRVKMLIVPDISTRLASMRTGKADWTTDVTREDAVSLIKTAPDLKYYKYIPGQTLQVGVRMDKQDLPFKDLRVRQALQMAVDRETIKRDLYGGEAEILSWPVSSIYKTVYIPMEQLPENVQSLYKYDPEKAKQLLAEAGYPKGFNSKMVIQSTSAATDLAAVLKSMWDKVGVNVELQPKEPGAFQSIILARSYDEMVLRLPNTSGIQGGESTPLRAQNYKNISFIDDPVIEAAFQEWQQYIHVNDAKVDELTRKIIPQYLGQAYVLATPAPYSYTLWQPWLKNYNGEGGGSATSIKWTTYPWVDQDLKEKMTGRR